MQTDRERFLDKIEFGEHSDECWLWLAQLNLDGYGRFKSNGRMVLAHRYSYEMFIGTIPPDKPFVLHDCDFPPCVNPRHLHVGTHTDNMREMVSRGLHSNGNKGQTLPGEQNGRSKLKGEDVLHIRHLANSLTQREIASMFGVSHVCIGSILRGKSWSHI